MLFGIDFGTSNTVISINDNGVKVLDVIPTQITYNNIIIRNFKNKDIKFINLFILSLKNSILKNIKIFQQLLVFLICLVVIIFLIL